MLICAYYCSTPHSEQILALLDIVFPQLIHFTSSFSISNDITYWNPKAKNPIAKISRTEKSIITRIRKVTLLSSNNQTKAIMSRAIANKIAITNKKIRKGLNEIHIA